MPLAQSIDTAFASRIGKGGMPDEAYAAALADVGKALTRLKKDIAHGALPLAALPAETRDLAATRAAARRLKEGATDLVILGVGGSSLGGQVLCQLAGHGVPGLGRFADGPRLHFMDNLDPFTFAAFLKHLPLETSRFVAISKSGGTGETLSQTIAAMTALKRAGRGGAIADHILGLSEPAKPGGSNALRALLEPEGVAFLDHHTGIGGRYSVLSNVGLLPAAAAGISPAAVRQGAAQALAPINLASRAKHVPVAVGAALNLAAMRDNRGIAVLMGYSDRLERFTRWWVQLWAESLGKGGKGSQPVAALGPVDQHSQQQLYLAGPRDKLFTVITVATAGAGSKIDAKLAARAGEAGLGGRTIGDFVAAQSRAMIDTFARNGCPVRHIEVEALDAETMGELLMHFMLETILTGYALGIDPFDQPAVEEAKVLAKRYLTEAG